MALHLRWRTAELCVCVSELETLSDLDQQTMVAVCGVTALSLSSPKSRRTRYW